MRAVEFEDHFSCGRRGQFFCCGGIDSCVEDGETLQFETRRRSSFGEGAHWESELRHVSLLCEQSLMNGYEAKCCCSLVFLCFSGERVVVMLEGSVQVVHSI